MTSVDEKERQQAGSSPEHSDGETVTHGVESHPASVTSPEDDEKLALETGFEPIRPAASQPRRLSIDTLSTLRRERSNNGYGVDDIEDHAVDAVDPGADGQPAPEFDPFEVGWENGDADEMCPRSFPTWRKWLIVIITSIGSVCV